MTLPDQRLDQVSEHDQRNHATFALSTTGSRVIGGIVYWGQTASWLPDRFVYGRSG